MTIQVAGMSLIGLALYVVFDLGPHWFMAIPWPIRWWMGELTFLALVTGLIVLGLRRSPPRPWALLDPGLGSERGTHRAIAWGLQAITVSFAWPFFAGRDGWGAIGDWDLHLQWYEALHASVLRFGQFPWWNPWNSGGWLLAAEPQFGLVAIDTPLVLLFGTSVGLRLAALAYLMLAVEGSRRLARLWLADPWAVAVVSVLYGWSGAIIDATMKCHALTMCHSFLPWILLFAFQIDRGVRPAIGLGIASAASVLAVIQYPTAYAAMIAGCVLVWGFLAQPSRSARVRYAAHLGVALGVFLTLAGWRTALTGLVFVHHPRKVPTAVDIPIHYWLDALLWRPVPSPEFYKDTYVYYLSCYIGPIATVAAFLSFRRGWRWWHTLLIACFVMATGSAEFYHPGYWVRKWPVFSVMHVVDRWRFPGSLGLALAAGSELQSWRSRSARFRPLATALALGIVLDLAVYAHQCLPSAWSIPPEEVHFPEGPASPTIVNIIASELYGNTEGFECLTKGYGVIRGYTPQLGYNRGRQTARLWRGHPAYLGEAWSEGASVTPTYWSPNRIEFRVQPYQEVSINQNPGSWWWINGAPAFPHLRSAEPTRPFVVRADSQGWLRLQIRPEGEKLAIGLTLAGIAIASLWLGIAQNLRIASRDLPPCEEGPSVRIRSSS
jgi:hypothetical protein